MLSMQARAGSLGLCWMWFMGVVVSAMALSGCGVVNSSMQAVPVREVEQELAWRAGSAVHVQTGNGAIEVVRAEPGVTVARIEAVLQSESPERLEAAQLLAGFTEDGALDVRVEWPGGRAESREGAQLRVIVPDANGLRLTSTNGTITAEGLVGEAVLQASNGSITVRRHEGVVRATTTNGLIRAEQCVGEAQLRASNGSITLKDATEPVSVITTNGLVDVSLAEQNAGPLKIQTSNGRVTLLVGSGFAGQLSLRTNLGSISTNLNGLNASVLDASESNRRVVRFGSAETEAAESSVTTTNGPISVSKR